MELRQLEYFVAIVENNSFTEAARKLYVSQPTLSKTVKRLEEELDTALFFQCGQRIALTEAGTVLYEKGRLLLAEAAHTRDLVSSELKNRRGRVRVATSCKMSLLPRVCDLLAQFARAYDPVSLDLNEASPEWIKDNLIRRNMDVGIIGEPLELNQPAFHTTVLLKCEYRLVLPRDHPLAGRGSVGYADLADQQWILYRPTFNLYHMIQAGCRAAGFEPKVVHTTSQPELMLSLVQQGFGVAVQAWPENAPEAVGQTWQGLAALPLQDLQSRFAVKLITLKDGYLSPAAHALVEFAASHPF